VMLPTTSHSVVAVAAASALRICCGAKAGSRPSVGRRRARSRISRTRELGTSVGYLGVRRPRRHLWCGREGVTANRQSGERSDGEC
jgi:hypothetical protein